jgi:hypothetical protein
MAICMNCAPWLVFPHHEQCPGKVWSALLQDYEPCSCTDPSHKRPAESDHLVHPGQSSARQ